MVKAKVKTQQKKKTDEKTTTHKAALTRKRPAAADKNKATDEEDEEDDDDGSESEDMFVDEGKTDRCKKQKFLQMIEEDTLPDYLIDEWKKTLKMKTGKLAKQRELINQAFDREKGQLVLNLKKPSFKILKDCLG